SNASDAGPSLITMSIEDLASFIADSPSPYHVVDNAADLLSSNGFQEVGNTESPVEPGARYVRRGGALIAWADGHHSPEVGFRLIGAHSDSPNLRLKPHAERVRCGFMQLAVEVYGGVLFNSWL